MFMHAYSMYDDATIHKGIALIQTLDPVNLDYSFQRWTNYQPKGEKTEAETLKNVENPFG